MISWSIYLFFVSKAYDDITENVKRSEAKIKFQSLDQPKRVEQLIKTARRVPLPGEITHIFDMRIEKLTEQKEKAIEWSWKFYEAELPEIEHKTVRKQSNFRPNLENESIREIYILFDIIKPKSSQLCLKMLSFIHRYFIRWYIYS